MTENDDIYESAADELNAANEAKLAWTLMCGVKRISLQIEETT